jgi:hypothetical protein
VTSLGRILIGPSASVVLLVALSPSGCGATTSGVEGITCSTDGDCNSGLKCLPYQVYGDAAVPSDGGCPSTGNECLAPCKSDSDCTSQGPGLVCFSACGGTAACEAAADLGIAQGDGGVEGSPEASGDASVTSDAPAEASSEGSAVEASAEASGD